LNPTVILVRHASTKLNEEGRIRAWTDVPIDKAQIPTIQRTASKLDLYPLMNPLYTSDLKRAVQTAEIIADVTMLEMVPDFRLRPWDVGEWSSFKLDDVSDKMRVLIDNPSVRAPGGEAFGTFLNRWKKAFLEFTTWVVRDPSQAVVVVTHSRNIEAARYFVTRDKSTLVTANTVPPGNATSWQVVGGRLVEIPIAPDARVNEEQQLGKQSDISE
jgi:broad specificity phosphatase PhoE